jgi:hypothetical protein
VEKEKSDAQRLTLMQSSTVWGRSSALQRLQRKQIWRSCKSWLSGFRPSPNCDPLLVDSLHSKRGMTCIDFELLHNAIRPLDAWADCLVVCWVPGWTVCL